MSAGDREDLLFLYAADALEDDERAEVEAWLADGGAAARAALAQAEREVAGLALGLAPVAPGSAVRERLLRRVRAPRARSARAGWLQSRRARAILAAGLAALLAGRFGYEAGALVADRRAQARVAALEAELAEVAAELAEVSAERDQLDEELAEQEVAYRALQSEQVLARKAIDTLSAEHAEALDLRGTAARPEARARVFWDWDSWYCFLRADGLAPEPDGVYALWLFTEDREVVAVGVFEANASGQATLVAPVPHDLGEVVRAGVSVEPDDRLGPGPRGTVVLLGSTAPASSG